MGKNKKRVLQKATKQLNDLLFICLSLPDEVWKEIPCVSFAEDKQKYKVPERLEGCYFVSNRGNVISLYRKKPLLLSQTAKNKSGYKQVKINGVNVDIHILVAELFIGKTEGFQVHHKDFNPLNNQVENLEILTHEEHLLKHGKIPREKGK